MGGGIEEGELRLLGVTVHIWDARKHVLWFLISKTSRVFSQLN